MELGQSHLKVTESRCHEEHQGSAITNSLNLVVWYLNAQRGLDPTKIIQEYVAVPSSLLN